MLYYRYPRLFYPVWATTLLIAGLSALPGIDWGSFQWVVFLLLALATGLPHGATDHVLHAYVARRQGRRPRWLRFFAFYWLLLLAFVGLWLVAPAVSLMIFLLVSAFHFGQSQLLHLGYSERHPLKIAAYLAWGGWLLTTLLYHHHIDAGEILRPVLRDTPGLWPGFVAVAQPLSHAFLLLVLGLFAFCYFRRRMSARLLLVEVLSLATLWALVVTAPLLVGFIVYFGLWHSLSSMGEEIKRLQTEHPSFGWKTFYQDAWPFTAISVLGIGLLIGASQWFSEAISPYLLFFIAISALTMPHVVEIGRFYAAPPAKASTADSTG